MTLYEASDITIKLLCVAALGIVAYIIADMAWRSLRDFMGWPPHD